jgi:hypothetical protein
MRIHPTIVVIAVKGWISSMVASAPLNVSVNTANAQSAALQAVETELVLIVERISNMSWA